MLRLAWIASVVVASLLAAAKPAPAARPSAAPAPAGPATPEFSKDDVEAMARAMAQPWPTVQKLNGTLADYSDDSPTEPDTRYGDAFMGYALLQVGLREGDDTLINAGLRAVSYSVKHYAEERKQVTQSVFENWAVPAAYNLARKRLGDNELFKRERGRWKDFLRVSRAERSGIVFEYGNHWLVDASGVLETLRSGLRSSRPDAVLGGQRSEARAGALSLINSRVPALPPHPKGPFLFSDPPDNPLAYEGLSLGIYAHLIRALGKRASGEAKDTLRRAADALWYDTGPDGDSAYFGRSQEYLWGAAGTAYGALVAANLSGTSRSRAARYRALADRSFARLRDAYPISDRGQFFVPGLAIDVRGTTPWLDGYAGAPSMDGIALVLVELALDEMKPNAAYSHIAADRPSSRAIGSGRGRIAMVRRGAVWFAVRMQPTAHRHHVGDLRYDSGVAVAKHRAEDGAWHDFVPVRPTTAAPGFDSAGPDVLSGNSVLGVPVGDRVETATGKVSIVGRIVSSSGSTVAPLRSTYVATACGVELQFAAAPGRTYEYSAFFRGTKSPIRDGGTLVGGSQTVTANPKPDTVHVKKEYGSANDPRLVRARMRFRVPKARTVHVEMC
jgi:hypothetical protein